MATQLTPVLSKQPSSLSAEFPKSSLSFDFYHVVPLQTLRLYLLACTEPLQKGMNISQRRTQNRYKKAFGKNFQTLPTFEVDRFVYGHMLLRAFLAFDANKIAIAS